MRTAESLIEELKRFPSDSLVYVYEGFEGAGVSVQNQDGEFKGFIPCADSYPPGWPQKDPPTRFWK